MSTCLDNNRVVVSKHLVGSGSGSGSSPSLNHGQAPRSSIRTCKSCNSSNPSVTNHDLKKDLQRFVTEALAEM